MKVRNWELSVCYNSKTIVFPSIHKTAIISCRVDVAAILNDTTGCLMSCAWKNPKCRIGLIIGTGTNACYLEDIDEVRKVQNCVHAQCVKTKDLLLFGKYFVK